MLLYSATSIDGLFFMNWSAMAPIMTINRAAPKRQPKRRPHFTLIGVGVGVVSLPSEHIKLKSKIRNI